MPEPAVNCAHDKLVPIGELKPHPQNPNTHPENQLVLLAKIIKEQGWRAPITVSMLSGFIVRGHARLEAAKRLGCEVVPVDFQDYPGEAAEMSDRIADNRLAELAMMDMPVLAGLLQELDTGVWDMELTGFDKKELERVMTWAGGGQEAPDDFHEVDENLPIEHICPKCGYRFSGGQTVPVKLKEGMECST